MNPRGAGKERLSMTESKRDLIWALVLGAASVGIYLYSDTFTSTFDVPALAESPIYSKIWAVALFLLSTGLAIRALRRKGKEDSTARPLATLGVCITVGALFVYLLVLKKLGFLISTIFFLTALIAYYQKLSRRPSARSVRGVVVSLLRPLALSTVIAVLLTLIFGAVLGVSLPAFTLFGN